MSDGKIIFDTLLDYSKLQQGLNDVKKKIQSVSADTLKTTGSAFEQTGAKLTNYITKPALAAVTAIGGVALVKGFNRLKNIDQAKAKLEGLGHSAQEVQNIMDSAMDSVKGTAYGFDQAATAAASAVAAGIKPGKELTKYLGLIGDAAAISGRDFNEMGAIFNKITSAGKVSMEELNQITDSGIPIIQQLAKEYGVSAAELRDMVSKGKVDSETFLAAIEHNMGGAAVIMGQKSFSGALANIGASLSRIGANFLDAGGKGGGFFSQLKPLMGDMMDTMYKIEEKSAQFGETFGKAFANAVKIIRSVPKPLLAIGAGFAVSIGPALKLTGGILKSAAAMKTFKAEQAGMSVISGVVNGKLTLSQAAFIKFSGAVNSSIKAVPKFVKAQVLASSSTLKSAGSTMIDVASKSKLGGAISKVIPKIVAFGVANKVALGVVGLVVAAIAALVFYIAKTGNSAEETAELITNAANKAADMITNFANMISRFADNLPAVLDTIIPAFVQALNSIINVIPKLIPQLINAGIQLFMALVDSLSKIIVPLVGALILVVKAIVDALPVLIPALINAGITLFMALVDALDEILPALIDGFITIINALIDALPVIIPALVQAFVALFMALVKAIPQIIVAIVQAIIPLGAAIVKGIKASAGSVKEAGVSLVKNIWVGFSSWVGRLVSNVKSAIKGLPSAVKSGLGSLKSIGGNWIKGLWNGIGNKKNWLIGKIKSLCSDAKQAIKNYFGIKSPSRVMAEIGKFITMGLGVGIESKTASLLDTINTQMEQARNAYNLRAVSPSFASSVSSRFTKSAFEDVTSDGVAGGASYTQNNYFYRTEESPIETARALKNQNTFGLAGGWS